MNHGRNINVTKAQGTLKNEKKKSLNTMTSFSIKIGSFDKFDENHMRKLE